VKPVELCTAQEEEIWARFAAAGLAGWAAQDGIDSGAAALLAAKSADKLFNLWKERSRTV
jgi:hypothetical protein